MANNATVTLTFKVQSDGTLKQVTGDINKATKATDSLGASQARASKASNDYNYTQNAGVIGAANSTRSFSKLSQSIGNDNNGLVGAYATLAANSFAVSAAFNALRSAAQVEQLMKGLEIQGSRTGRTLSLVSDNIVSITKGSISSAEAMVAASQGNAANLTSKDLLELTTVATNASIALGRNIPDSMDRIIKGVTKLEPELLDELGLMTKLTEASENYARANGKSASSLTRLEKSKSFVEAIKQEGDLKFGGISDQVDANRFDQLASTFKNLTNAILGSVAASSSVDGIMSILIDTTYGLQGALVLFLSTIGKSMVGWLYNLSASAASAAVDLRKVALEQRKLASASLAVSSQKVGVAATSFTAATDLSSKMPKRFKESQAAIESGKASAENYATAIDSLERSNRSYEGQIKKLQKSETASTDAVKEKIEILQKEKVVNTSRISAIEEVKNAQLIADSSELSNRSKVMQARASGLAAVKTEAAAQAISAAGSGKLKSAFENTSKSVAAYSRELQRTRVGLEASALAAGVATPAVGGLRAAFDAAKVSGYGFILTMKAVGTALASALPFIGVIMLLYSAGELLYNTFFVTEAEKAKKKALEDLGTVLESTTKNIKELTRVSNLDVQEGTKTAKITEIKLNSLIELADAYAKVGEAASLAADNELKARIAKDSLGPSAERSPAAALERSRIDAQNELANAAGVGFDSKALAVFSDTIDKTYLGFGSFNEEGLKAIQTADQLNKLSPEIAKGFFEGALGAKTQGEKIKLLAKALKEASAEYSPIRDKLAEFTEALKSAETSQTDFLKSLKPTTPFDEVLGNFQALSKSMAELDKLMNSQEGTASKDFTGNFQKIVTQLGPNVSKALDAGGQVTLSSYNDLTTQINSLNKAIDEGKSKKQDTKILEQDLEAAAAQRVKYESYLGKIIPEQVDAYTQMLASAQEQTILAQSQVTLAQARLSVIQRQGTVTGADIRRQMEGQNAVLAAQVAQEKIKLQFIKLDIQKLDITIQEIIAQQELLEILKKQNIEKDAAAQKAMLANVRLERANLIAQNKAGSPEAIELAVRERELIKPLDQRNSQEDLKRNRRQAEQTRRTLEASANATGNAIAALSMQAFTSTEISVQAALQDLKVSKEIYEAKKNILNVTMARAHQEEKLANLLNMRTKDNLKAEIKAINELATQKATEREKEFKFKEDELKLNIRLANSRGLSNQVGAFETQLDLEKRKNAADQASIESQRAIEILNKVAIKDEEDLISRKQDILSFQEKILQAKRTEVDASRALFESEVDLNAKLRGVTDTAATDRIKAIKAAKDAYELAKEEDTFKKAQIDLEFQLLKAKRALLMMEITTAQATLKSEQSKTSERIAEITKLKNAEEARIIEAEKKANKNNPKGEIVVTGNVASPLLTQLNAEGASLGSTMVGFAMQNNAFAELSTYFNTTLTGTFDEAATKMKDAITKGTEAAANKVAEAVATGPLVTGGLASQLQNMKQRQKGREDAGVSEKSLEGVSTTVLQEMDTYIESVKENLKSLGPEGEIVLATAIAAQSIGSSFVDAFKTMGDAEDDWSQKTVGALQAVSAVIAGVASILKATSDAKIANIDKEIAAEQRRDGKSAASLEKIKMMEKKKDESARKSFNIQKKLMMAQAVVSTAAAIAMAIGQLGPIAGPIMAGVMAAMGMAQIAIIAGTSYESASPSAVSTPTSLSIGKRSDTVDLAKGPNANAGGEAGYLRGAQGTGTNASNFRTVGSAYGGELMRGYGNRGFVVGEKGPEVITPDTPITVTPANDVGTSQPVNATFNIHAIDSQGVQDVLVAQKGNIIKMLRDTANASGKSFMEDVNVNVYTRPSVGKL